MKSPRIILATLAIALLLLPSVALASDIVMIVYPLVGPTVTANPATNVTHTSGILQGEITKTGNNDPSIRGFEWGYFTGNYTQSWNETGSFSLGTYNHTINNLTLGTQVFFRAFAINTIGTGHSGEESFTTLTLPFAPTNFKITQVGVDSANITWTKGAGANITIVRGSTIGYPFSPIDGDDVYSGNGTNVVVVGLDLDSNVYYYRAWSENEFGYSENYAQARIGREGGFMTGDLTSTIIGIICIAAMIAGFALKQGLILICAGTGWVVFGALMYDTTSELNTVMFILGLAFAIVCFVWPLVTWMRTRTRRLSPEEKDYETYRRKVIKTTTRRLEE